MSPKLKQTLITAAILAIGLVFVMQFRPGASFQQTGPAPGPTCAVENDGRCIVSQSDFVTTYRLVAAQQLDNEELRDRMRGIVLEGLIQRWLLLEDAKRLGVAVSDDYAARALARGLARVSLPADLESSTFVHQLGLALPPEGPARSMGVLDPKTQGFSYERYQKWVQRVSNKTINDFREFANAEELAARMREIIKSRVRVSEGEARALFAEQSAKIAVDYVELDRDFFQRHADASPDAVAKWAEDKDNAKEVDDAFEAKKDDFMPECRKARQILVRVDDTASDKQAAKQKARAEILAAKKRLDHGDDFAVVARETSDDAQQAAQGGDLGCFAQGKLAKPSTAKAVDDAAYALQKGKVSDVLETSFGFHLVKLDEVFKGDAAEKEAKAEIARDKYLRAEGERRAAEAAKAMLAAVKGGKTLQQALDAELGELQTAAPHAKGKDKTIAAVNPHDPAPSDADAPKIATSKDFTIAGPPFVGVKEPGVAARALFAIDKPGGAPSDVIELYDGYAVAVLKEKKPLDDKEWQDKRGELMDELRHEKERDALVAYVHELRQKRAKTISYKIPLHEEREDKKGKSRKAED